MTDFTDISSLYEHMERDSIDYSNSFVIGQLICNLRNILEKSGNSADAEIAQWEIDFLFVIFHEGKAKPFASTYDEKGEYHEYPNMEINEDRRLQYLIKRAESVNNPILKARYYHILWCSPKKHYKWAKGAIDNYLLSVKIYEKEDKEKPDEHFGLKIIESIKNAYYLAKNIKTNFEEIKSEIIRLISSFNQESDSSPALRTQLIKLAIEDKKIFSKEDLKGFDTFCENTSKIWISRNNLLSAITVYELAERWEMKCFGTNSGIWRQKIAESYESMMSHKLEKGEVASGLHFCIQAVLNYKKIKAEDKVKELETLYTENKDKVEFKEFSEAIDLSDHVKSCKKFADNLIKKNSPEQIIGFLAFDERYLLPKLLKIIESVKELDKTYPLRTLFQVTTTDQQNNLAQTFSSDDDRFSHRVLEQYRINLEAYHRVIIREIIFSAILEGKITTKEIISFLEKNSWTGKIFFKKSATHKIPYTWVSLLAPSLDEYFKQISLLHLNNSNISNFILCIDSLTLKIEGLLRDFFIQQKISTTTIKQEGITREKLLNELFEEPKMTDYFSEDEIFFLKFLLIEQAGYNLRHRIAHSFMISQDYAVDYMNYLIIAMLRICKFNFIEKNPSNEESS